MSGRYRLVLLFVALALFFVGYVSFQSELIDDAYISLRYARNLAEGHGLSWNPGEAVEGYTDFFWVLLLSLSGAAPTGAMVLGAAAGALLLVVVAYPPDPLRTPGLTGALLPVTIAANTAFSFWAAKGLETALFTLLLTVGLFAHAATRSAVIESGGSPSSRARHVRVGLVAILLLSVASLTRPEGCLFLVLALADRVRHRNDPIRWHAVLLAFLLLAPHLAFRLSYYGHPLPNTYYAKVGFGPEQFLRGLAYLWRYFAHPGSVLFIVAVVACVSRSAPLRFLGAALAAGLAGIVYVGGDAFGAHRFLVPLVPALHLLTLAGFARMATTFTARGGWSARAATVAPPLLALLLAVAAFASTRAAVLNEEREVARFTSLMVEVGKVLKEKTPPGVTIALNPTGAIPYYSERRAIDMLGLNDEWIAHSRQETMGTKKAGHEKGDGAYVLRRRPELILIGNVWVDEQTTITKIFPSRTSEVQLMKLPETYDLYEMTYFTLPDGVRSVKALALRERTSLPKSGWAPTNFTTIPKPRWE